MKRLFLPLLTLGLVVGFASLVPHAGSLDAPGATTTTGGTTSGTACPTVTVTISNTLAADWTCSTTTHTTYLPATYNTSTSDANETPIPMTTTPTAGPTSNGETVMLPSASSLAVLAMIGCAALLATARLR